MNLWNFFKRKKKTKSGICFSKEKSKEELVKNFLEINADKIETITTETGEELTGNTSKFFLYLKDGRKVTVLINPKRDFLLKQQIGLEIFLEKLKSETFKNIDEKELFEYNSLFVIFEAVSKEEEKENGKLLDQLAVFLGEFYKFIIQKNLKHYHYNRKRMVQNNEKWEISDFIPPLSDKMFFEYEIEMTDNDAERMKKNIEILRENGLPYDEKMEVSISEKDVKIYKKWDIIRRIVAIVVTRLAAETYLEKKENGKKELAAMVDVFEENYQFKQVLSEREKDFIENLSEDKDLNAEFYFRLESAKMLLWVLSIIDIEFQDFNTFCDISILINGIKNENLKSFARKCEIRSKNKIMDMLDYIYRLNWANVEIKMNGYERIVNESILYFSRLAVEWVVQDGKSMDDIVIHT